MLFWTIFDWCLVHWCCWCWEILMIRISYQEVILQMIWLNYRLHVSRSLLHGYWCYIFMISLKHFWVTCGQLFFLPFLYCSRCDFPTPLLHHSYRFSPLNWVSNRQQKSFLDCRSVLALKFHHKRPLNFWFWAWIFQILLFVFLWTPLCLFLFFPGWQILIRWFMNWCWCSIFWPYFFSCLFYTAQVFHFVRVHWTVPLRLIGHAHLISLWLALQLNLLSFFHESLYFLWWSCIELTFMPFFAWCYDRRNEPCCRIVWWSFAEIASLTSWKLQVASFKCFPLGNIFEISSILLKIHICSKTLNPCPKVGDEKVLLDAK